MNETLSSHYEEFVFCDIEPTSIDLGSQAQAILKPASLLP